MTERWVALLGQSDTPTDAVEDYCGYLADALEEHRISLEVMRVKWVEKGWHEAFRDVRKKTEEYPGSWFLVQYTALGWSRRGFPLRFPKLIRFLKNRGARCAVVFHDANPYAGSRMIDWLRRTLQIYAMRQAHLLADLSVLTIPPEKVPWISGRPGNIIFAPVGANLPSPERAWSEEKKRTEGAVTIGVFSVSSGLAGKAECGRGVRSPAGSSKGAPALRAYS